MPVVAATTKEAERVAAERGITISRARRFIREREATRISAEHPVPANQKAKILANLFRGGKAQTLKELRLRLVRDNFVIDAHGLVHVLWSMQKDQHVTFRERLNSPPAWEGPLTAIRLTNNGNLAARRVGKPVDTVDITRREIVEQAQEDARAINGTAFDEARDAFELATADLSEPEAVAHIKESVAEVRADPPISFFIEYPLIGKMVNRQARLEAAAKILEEEGEQDLALSTLEKVSYSPFEQEVLRLVGSQSRR